MMKLVPSMVFNQLVSLLCFRNINFTLDIQISQKCCDSVQLIGSAKNSVSARKIACYSILLIHASLLKNLFVAVCQKFSVILTFWDEKNKPMQHDCFTTGLLKEWLILFVIWHSQGYIWEILEGFMGDFVWMLWLNGKLILEQSIKRDR